ncbi:MAG: AIPR family protein [Coriobacteriia bacterium]|nr:AIPR family protein [Coriobacteriia bacterium]
MDTKIRDQILEDIRAIQGDYLSSIPNLKSDDYAFNFWVLTKLYCIDEEIAISYITDNSDRGIDCWVYFEEAKELYLIQNKFYTTAALSRGAVIDEFLSRPLEHLRLGSYTRSKDLQDIFTKFMVDTEFKIHLVVYTTQDKEDTALKNEIDTWSYDQEGIKAYIDAKMYQLDDIKETYYGEQYSDVINFECEIATTNQGTLLNIDPEHYSLPNLIKARYILTSVTNLFEIVKKAEKKNYQLFEENIREYLGNKGVNNKIIATLRDPKERGNFFFYNNGITIICESFVNGKNKAATKIFNPQIVNGCQTVNSIFDVISKVPAGEMSDFDNTYVMVKVLQVDKENNKSLYLDIVLYNNSQNAIKEKDFAANHKVFNSLKNHMEDRGFALYVKQSDEYKYKNNKALQAQMRKPAANYFEYIGLEDFNTAQMGIRLEKLLQVLMAFQFGGYEAFTKKNTLLKRDSKYYNELLEMISNVDYSVDQIIKLYLLFLYAELQKKGSEDNRTPIPYYVLDFIGKDYRDSANQYLLFEKDSAMVIYNFYKSVANQYRRQIENSGTDYNKMIKQPIREDVLNGAILGKLDDLESEQRGIIKRFRTTVFE